MKGCPVQVCSNEDKQLPFAQRLAAKLFKKAGPPQFEK